MASVDATWVDANAQPVLFSTNGGVSILCSPALPNSILVALTISELLDPGAQISVTSSLIVNAVAAANSIATASFDHTAQLSITLPAGWSFVRHFLD
jgi:hypothetical protein